MYPELPGHVADHFSESAGPRDMPELPAQSYVDKQHPNPYSPTSVENLDNDAYAAELPYTRDTGQTSAQVPQHLYIPEQYYSPVYASHTFVNEAGSVNTTYAVFVTSVIKERTPN